jgi:thiol-disulfide isomerase/thioredoxin
MVDRRGTGPDVPLRRRSKVPPGPIALVLLVAVVVMLGRSTPGLGGQGLSQAACPPAPRFTLPDLEGQSRSLAEFLGGRPILLEFMSPDCPHCNQAAPVLRALHAEYGARVQFLTVAFENSGNVAQVQAFARRHQHPWPYLLGDEGVIQAYRLEGVPTFFFLGGKGGVCGVRVGYSSADVLRQGLEMALTFD